MSVLKTDRFSVWLSKLQHLLLMVKRARERNGVFLALFKGGRLLWLRLWRRLVWLFRYRQYRQRTDELIARIQVHPAFFDLLHIPVGWNTLMFQRYQHLSLEFARLGGFALYGGNPETDKDLFVYQMRADGLYVFDATDAHLLDRIVGALRTKSQPKIVRIQSIDMQTTYDQIARFLAEGFTVVYEYIDVLSPIITGVVPDFVSSRHEKLLTDPRVVVVATADKLLAEVKSQRQTNYLLSTNGVSVADWRGAGAPIPEDLKKVTARGNLIAGYHGALAQWLDYDLLRAIADSGEYDLVLLGLEHDSSFKMSGLAEHANVHFLGSKPFSQLPEYACYYDIAILPFLKNELTDSISPVKLFEYMAARKPIVTTDLHECRKYQSCFVARDHTDFLQKLNLAASSRNDPHYLALLDQDAENNSWRQKAIKLLQFMNIPVETN